MPDWFQKVFECHENDATRDTKIKLVRRGKKTFIETKNYKYLAGDFTVDTLEMIKNKAKSKALAYLQINKNKLPFDNKFNIINLENIEIMEEINDLVNEKACFQVASQTNCLEHVNDTIGPKQGITIYKDDFTQGPACAIATAPGTYYRNYFSLPGDKPQTDDSDTQINTLHYLEEEIKNTSGDKYFSIKNGYVSMNAAQKVEFKKLLGEERYRGPDKFYKNFTSKIGVGIMSDTEAIIGGNHKKMHFFKYEPNVDKKFTVSQIFCSAINLHPVHGTPPDPYDVDILAEAILEAQYEATLWFAVFNAIKTGVNAVYLTKVGGGVFENDDTWIKNSMEKAILAVQEIRFPLNVYIVHHKSVENPIYYELENMSYDFNRNKNIYYDANMNEYDDPGLNISLKELYRRIDKNYGKLDKLTKKVNQKIKNSSSPLTFSNSQVNPLKKCATELDDMIDMI